MVIIDPAYVQNLLRHSILTMVRIGYIPIEEFKAGQDIGDIKAEYADRLSGLMHDYMDSERPITSFRNEHRRAISDAFTLAFVAGYADAGASGELPDKAVTWLNDRINSEIGFSDGLFQDLRDLRVSDKTAGEKDNYIRARALGYTGTLDSIYSQGMLMGDEEQELEFLGDDGIESCDTCQNLKGQKHPASWWIENDLIPAAGNQKYICGGWNCAHFIQTNDGEIIAHGGGYL